MEGPLWNDELVHTPSEDERLDNLPEEKEDVSPKDKLVLVEAASATSFGELGAERRLS